MFVMITETGEVRQLSFIHWQDRLEYAESLISHSADASNFIFDAETETFSTDAATFRRWQGFCEQYKDIDSASSAIGLPSSLRSSYDALMHL